MPDTYVQMPDNSYIQFPEGTPDDVINRVAQEHATGISTKSKPAPPAAVPSSQPGAFHTLPVET